MFTQLESSLLALAHTVPLELFAFVASFIEEVVAPIPSPTVMVLTGTIASFQSYTILGLLFLAIIAALGKTIGAIVVYFITDRAENLIMERFGKFIGVSHEDVESFGEKLGNGYRDYFLLTLFRALPFVPSVVVSVGSGLLKVPLRLFIITTFFGTIIRDSIYLYFGFVGTQLLGALIQKSASVETLIELLALIGILVILGFLYHKRARTR